MHFLGTNYEVFVENATDFREEMLFIYQQFHDLGMELLRDLTPSLGVSEDFFEQHHHLMDHTLELKYYPEPTSNISKFILQIHCFL